MEATTKATEFLFPIIKYQELRDTASADKLKVPCASSNSIFHRLSTSYRGISSIVPALLAEKAPSSPLAKNTARAQPKATFMNEIDVISEDIEAKIKTTDILIADKIKEHHFLSIDMPKSTCASSNSIFPCYV
eukprot:scaffold101006_cov31-Attheya_sp.AAC.4